MHGVVTHPEDLTLAISTMPHAAKEKMDESLNGSEPTPNAIATAFDWYREKFGHNTPEELALREKYLGDVAHG